MMRLGTQTGSLVNHILSRGVAQEVAVGDPATVLHWSDRSPATVVEIFTKGKFTYFVTQEDHAKRTDSNGYGGQQEYEYSRNPNGREQTWKVTPEGIIGVYRNPETGRFVKNGESVAVGRREKYRDPSF
tara:strand:- start:14 stop:400 length:387 start_codon:yes stop_codon:yes gene_type:complete